MPIIQSKLKNGTLTIGGTSFATQASNVTLTPDTSEDGDTLEVLSGDTILPEERTAWTLNLGLIQDFTSPAGLIQYSYDNAGDVVAFSWKPDGADAFTVTGSVKVRPIELGGDVGARLTTSAEWPCQGTPVFANPV